MVAITACLITSIVCRLHWSHQPDRNHRPDRCALTSSRALFHRSIMVYLHKLKASPAPWCPVGSPHNPVPLMWLLHILSAHRSPSRGRTTFGADSLTSGPITLRGLFSGTGTGRYSIFCQVLTPGTLTRSTMPPWCALWMRSQTRSGLFFPTDAWRICVLTLTDKVDCVRLLPRFSWIPVPLTDGSVPLPFSLSLSTQN